MQAAGCCHEVMVACFLIGQLQAVIQCLLCLHVEEAAGVFSTL
jgi:hypothetical protein